LRALLPDATGRDPDPTAVIRDGKTPRGTPESGHRAGDAGHKRTKGSTIHAAVDTRGHLLALRGTPATAQERAQVGALADAVQEATGNTVELAGVDQGDTGKDPAAAAEARSIDRTVGRLPEATKGVVLLPRRWVVERSFAWASRFRRLAQDDERLPETVAGLHFVAFACRMLHKMTRLPLASP
jgi:transposase